MVALAEANFYGAVGVVRKALQDADEPGERWCTSPRATPRCGIDRPLPGAHGPWPAGCASFAELPVSELENAWLSGVKQMGMALPPEHPMFRVAQRELGRWVVHLRHGAHHAVPMTRGAQQRCQLSTLTHCCPCSSAPTISHKQNTKVSTCPTLKCRLIPDAAARPALQEELKGVQTKVQELLYVMKQVQPQGGAEAAGDSGQAPATEEFLP